MAVTRSQAREYLADLINNQKVGSQAEARQMLADYINNDGVEQSEQPLLPAQEGLASIPFTSASEGEEFVGAEKDIQDVDLTSTPQAIQGQIAQAAQTPEAEAGRLEARTKAIEAMPEDRTATDIAMTKDVARDPSAGFGQGFVGGLKAIGGFSSILARGAGALTGQGNIEDESTKVLKPLIESTKEWVESREAQNTSADVMIDNLKNAMEESALNGAQRRAFQEQIDALEEGKNSGTLTTAVDVLNNLTLETASDPASWIGVIGSAVNVAKGVGKSLMRRTGKEIAEKVVGQTADEMVTLGIKNPKMLDYIDAQPGRTVREKLASIRNRQAGETTSGGTVQASTIENMFDDSTLKQLEANAEQLEGKLAELKSLEVDVKSNIKGKKKEAEADIKGEAEIESLDIDVQAGEETLAAEQAGEKLKGAIREGAKKDIEAVPSSLDPKETVEAFTKGGEFSGRGINKSFEEAEALAKTGAVDVPTRKKLIGEMLAAAEGDVDRTVDYGDVVNKLFSLRKDAPLADFKRALMDQGFDPAFAESFRRLKQGTVNDVKASKRQFNKALAKEGVALDDTVKRSADVFKSEADKVVENTMGPEGYQKLLSLEATGGKEASARKKLLKIMKLDPKKTEIVEDIDFNDAIANLDEFINKSAKQYAKDGKLPDMDEPGRFPAFKKYFGIDVGQEVVNRAKKLDIAEEAVTAEKGIEQVTSQAVGKIEVDRKKALKGVKEASESARNKVRAISEKSAEQVKKGFSRRKAETAKELKRIKAEASKAGSTSNVYNDFRKEVADFAENRGFSRDTESFKAFESKYGKKLAGMVEDQAILSVFEVSSSGKIQNAENLSNAFKGVYGVTPEIRAAKVSEGILNKVGGKIRSYDKRLDNAFGRIKSRNKQLAKDLNRIKKRGGDTDEAFRLLMDKQPLITADILSSEFKFISPLDFYDKAFLSSVANSTDNSYTAKEKMAAKRMLQKTK